MNSCKAYVDRVWDEGEAFGEGGGVLSKKKTGILVVSLLIDGFHSDVIKLQSQNSEVLRILIYTGLKINKK